MNSIKMKIGHLFEKFATNVNIIDDIVKPKLKVKIKSESGKIVNIVGLIKKSKCKIYKLEFENKTTIKCADKHLIKVNTSKFDYVENLNIDDYVLTTSGFIQIINKKVIKVDYVYDIAMEEEHVYTTPNGLIHHNSMLACQTLANAQQIYKGQKFVAGYLDSEESTSTIRLAQLGVKYPPITPIGDVTVEKVFKFLEGMCLFKDKNKISNVPSVCIWDSIANTLAEKERAADDVNQVIGFKARMLSILVPKYVARVALNNICWIAVNQLRDTISMNRFGPQPDLKFMTATKQMPGGQVLRFNAFQLLEMGVKSAIKKGEGVNAKYGFDGIIGKVKIVKNKLFVPNVQVEILGSFVNGFSDFWTSYYHLTESKRLKTGQWNCLTNFPDKKFRTKDALITYNTDKEFKDAFDDAVTDHIQKEIIDKYTIVT